MMIDLNWLVLKTMRMLLVVVGVVGVKRMRMLLMVVWISKGSQL